MGLDAGSVFVTLGGKLDMAGFAAYGAKLKESVANSEAAEGRIKASNERVSRSFGSIAKSAVGFTAAYAGIRGLGDVLGGTIKTAVDFEKSMRNVNSIAGLSEPAFQKLSKSVLQLSGKTAQAPKTLAEGLYQLVSSGFDAHDSLTILASTSKAATAGLTDTETATTAVAGALNAYHLKASDAAHVSDQLFQTVNRGVISFPQLAQTIGTVLPFAATLHIGLDQVGASISTLTKEGIPAAEATTYLKNAMVQFLKPSDALAASIEKTGFSSGESLVKAKGFQGALEAVAKTTDGTKSALQAMFPDIRASAAVFALTGKNIKTADADLKGFSNTAVNGATAKVFAEQSKSVAFQTQQLKANLDVLGVEVGSALLPTINHIVKSVSEFVKQMSDGTGAGGEFAAEMKKLGGEAEHTGEVLMKIGKDLGLGNLQNDVRVLEDLAAAFLAFKTASGAIAVIGGLARALATLRVAYIALRVAVVEGEVPALILAFLDPITAIPAAIALAALAFTALGGKLSDLRGPVTFVLGIFSDLLGAVQAVGGVLGHLPGVGGAFKAMGNAAGDAKHGVDDLVNSLNGVGDVKITPDVSAAVAAIDQIDKKSIKKKVAKIVADGDATTAQKIKAIEALGIHEKTAKIITAGIPKTLADIAAIQTALGNVQNKTVTVTVQQIANNLNTSGHLTKKAPVPGLHATGRGPGGAETALVGEGNAPELVGNPDSGWAWVTQPTLMGLAPGDAVIPSDPQYAANALGFMFGAMGIPGYLAGRAPVRKAAPKKRVLPVPAAVKYGAVAEDDLKNSRDNARESYQKRKERVHNLDVSIREQKVKVREAKAGKAKRTAQAKLDGLTRDRHHYNDGGGGLASVDTLHNRYLELNREVGVLHRYNLDIDRLNTRQETDRTRMDTASKSGNAALWTSARTDRNSILAQLRDRYAKALKLAKPGSSFADQLDSQLAGIQSDIADAAADVFTPTLTPAQQAAQDAADRESQTGLTDAEQKQLDQLHANVSLASLTTDTGDDQAAAQQLQTFLAGVLQEVQADPARGGAASVADIADQLKQAQDNVASFTSGSSQNDNQNLQAQLDQANQALQVSQREAQINAQGLAAYQSFGNGPQVIVQQTINTLHPGDPATQSAVSDAAVAGMSYQASRPSSTTHLGL